MTARVREGLRDSEWQPTQAWPDTVTVQWGGRGVVVSREPGGSYGTAFFEAFPAGGGFIRGEGKTIDDAEADAFRQYQREAGCAAAGGHRWSRTRRYRDKPGGPLKFSTYTNGGCFCLRCGSFKSAMPEIVKLGDWMKPLDASTLVSIAEGYCRANAAVDRMYPPGSKHRRKLLLRAKLAGIKLPEHAPPRDPNHHPFEPDAYELACRKAVADYYRARKDEVAKPGGSVMQEFFDGFSQRHLESLLLEEMA